jgi:AraC-like DNA-binding protein
MKHVSILVPDGECSITNIEGTYQILLRVNEWLEEAGRLPLFTVQLVGFRREVRLKNGLFSSQSPFIIFSGQKGHEDEAIRKAQEFIEKNVHSKIMVDELASMLALGRRNLERRFKKATGNSIMEYIQRVKMEAVKKSLETSRLGVNEAMDRVGYSDPKAFRVIFKKVTGLSPLQYRNRYNREFV